MHTIVIYINGGGGGGGGGRRGRDRMVVGLPMQQLPMQCNQCLSPLT